MSYQREREQFIARMTREGLELRAIHSLLRQATTINRLAELACSSEAADRDRIKCPADTGLRGLLMRKRTRYALPCLCDSKFYDDNRPHEKIPRIRLQDYQAEQRAIRALPEGWQINTQGDPRGWCLRVIPPSYAERNAGRDRHNLEAIGVPPGPSGLRW